VPQAGRIPIDICAARLRERPDPWLDGDLDSIERCDLNLRATS